MKRLRRSLMSLRRRDSVVPISSVDAETLRTVEQMIVSGGKMHMPRSEARDFTEEELVRAAWADLAIENPSLEYEEARDLLLEHA